jgi:hypothetical protein
MQALTMPSNTNWLPGVLLSAALLAGPAVIAVLVSVLINTVAPKELQPSMLTLVGVFPITMGIWLSRREADSDQAG